MRLNAGDTTRLVRHTVTSGSYMGEEGVGYTCAAPGEEIYEGDISHLTHGRIQGNDRVVEAQVLRECELLQSDGGEWLIYAPGALGWGYSPAEAAREGYITLPNS